MKKTLMSVCLAASSLVAVSALTSCGNDDDKLVIGMVCIHDEKSTYDLNYMNALDIVKANNPDVVVKYIKNVDDTDPQATYAALVQLAESDCDIVIANSYGFENTAVDVAKEYPNILFAQCTGDLAHTAKLDNYCDGFASIYEGRYLAGIAAGMKLNDLGKTQLGYVGAYPYAEVKSGMTAFYLGARSVCPAATMMVSFTNSWGDQELESAAATALISKGAEVVSQHADTYGAPNVCKNKGKFNVSYNVSIEEKFPEQYLCYSSINYAPWFQYLVDCRKAGTKPQYDFGGSLKDGGVVVGKAGKSCPTGTQEAIDLAKQKLISGELNVFDCSKFTVTKANNPYADIQVDEDGHLTSYKADVDSDPDYTGDTETINNGVFEESKYRCAPYFNLLIDGITDISEVK